VGTADLRILPTFLHGVIIVVVPHAADKAVVVVIVMLGHPVFDMNVVQDNTNSLWLGAETRVPQKERATALAARRFRLAGLVDVRHRFRGELGLHSIQTVG